jgi:hypothetical protein
LAGVSVFTSEYAGQMFLVPLQATKVSTIITRRKSEMKNFLIVMVSRFTILKLAKSNQNKIQRLRKIMLPVVDHVFGN